MYGTKFVRLENQDKQVTGHIVYVYCIYTLMANTLRSNLQNIETAVISFTDTD